MAFELIPYQPVIFEAPDLPGYIDRNQKGYIGREQFQFKVATNDFTKFQLINSAEDNAPNTFRSLFSGAFFNHTTGSSSVNTAGITAIATMANVFYPSRTYSINLLISDLTEGTVEIYRGTDLIDTIEENGSYNYINASDGGTTNQEDFFVHFISANIGATISSYSAREYADNILLGIFDLDDNLEDDQTDNITYVRGWATGTVDWGSALLSAGKYKLGVSNKANEILNDNAGFDSQTNWVLDLDTGDSLAIINSSLRFEGGFLSSPSSSTATYANLVEAGKDYEITVYARIIDPSTQVTLTLGTTSGAAITSAGVYTQTITSDGTDLVITFEESGGIGQIELDAVIVREITDIATVDIEDVIFSQEMCHGDFSDDTLMLTWADLADNMGFGYGDTDFIQTLRLYGKITRGIGGDQEYDTNVNSSNQRKVFFFSELKVHELVTELVPEYIHDALMLIRGHDGFAIDDISYKFQPGEYLPDWSDENDYEAPVILEIMRSAQAPPKVRCLSGSDPSVTFPPSYILLEDGGKILLEDGTGAILKENQF